MLEIYSDPAFDPERRVAEIMPMGIVTDKDFEAELDKCDTPPPIPNQINSNVNIVEMPTPGRSDGDQNVPESLRKLIGEQANIEGRASALELAESFNISPSSVSAYANGATSTKTYNKEDDELSQYLRDRKNHYSKRALKKLGKAITLMTTDKLVDCTAPQLAHVASVMSTVVKNLEPTKTDSTNDKGSNGPTFVFMVPPTKDESKYGAVIHSRE